MSHQTLADHGELARIVGHPRPVGRESQWLERRIQRPTPAEISVSGVLTCAGARLVVLAPEELRLANPSVEG